MHSSKPKIKFHTKSSGYLRGGFPTHNAFLKEVSDHHLDLVGVEIQGALLCKFISCLITGFDSMPFDPYVLCEVSTSFLCPSPSDNGFEYVLMIAADAPRFLPTLEHPRCKKLGEGINNTLGAST